MSKRARQYSYFGIVGVLGLFLNLATNMKTGLFALSFVVSVGLVVFGLMTAYRLKKKDEKSFASSLFYYVVFMTAFGFYSIWSYLAVRFLLAHVISSPDTLLNVVSIFPFLGSPLILVGWYLFIQFCIELTGRKLRSLTSLIYFSCCALLFLLLGNYFKNQLIQNEVIRLSLVFESLAIANLTVVLLGCLVFVFGDKYKLRKFPHRALALFFLAPIVMATIALFMASSHWLAIILFVLFFFSHIAIPPAWLYFQMESGQKNHTDLFEEFCQRFDISKREAEIIKEICLGKTNQQIADSLFIAVQTVKDHAHHIYTKTGVKNRVQLANLVNERTKRSTLQIHPDSTISG